MTRLNRNPTHPPIFVYSEAAGASSTETSTEPLEPGSTSLPSTAIFVSALKASYQTFSFLHNILRAPNLVPHSTYILPHCDCSLLLTPFRLLANPTRQKGRRQDRPGPSIPPVALPTATATVTAAARLPYPGFIIIPPCNNRQTANCLPSSPSAAHFLLFPTIDRHSLETQHPKRCSDLLQHGKQQEL